MVVAIMAVALLADFSFHCCPRQAGELSAERKPSEPTKSWPGFTYLPQALFYQSLLIGIQGFAFFADCKNRNAKLKNELG